MPRTPRIYQVSATYRNGETSTRHYQTPEAAEERRARFALGRPQAVGRAAYDAHVAAGTTPPRDVPLVTVTASHPITYPRAAGDPDRLAVPDSTISADLVLAFYAELGIDPLAVEALRIEGMAVAVEYRTDPSGKAAPGLWQVAIE